MSDLPPLRGRDVAIALVASIAWVTLVRPGPLSLPFFWDEADVYVPGARWLAQNGLDFRPGVFPDDWSRGHPPLLYFVSGLAFKLFGATPVVGHLLVLPFAVLALASTWLLGDTLFGRPVGLAAALLLGTTPLFMSMANMLLPEMFLTGLTALALLLYARGSLLGASICGAALVLIKETGVFVPTAIVGATLWEGWRAGSLRTRRSAARLALAAAPIAVLCGFFAWQKLLAGYFVFPHHQNLLWDRPFGVEALWTVFPSMFAWHGRWIGVAVAVGATAWAIRRREGVTPRPSGAPRPVVEAVTVAIVLLIAANAVFFAKMFWLERYALPAHPGLLVLVAAAVLRLRPPAIGWAVVTVVCLLGIRGLYSTPGADEAELTFAYADVIATHRQAFDALPEGAVVLTAWPMIEELRQPELGFVEEAVDAVHARHLVDDVVPPTFDHVLLAARSNDASAMRAAAASRGLRLVGTFRIGAAPQAIELYAP